MPALFRFAYTSSLIVATVLLVLVGRPALAQDAVGTPPPPSTMADASQDASPEAEADPADLLLRVEELETRVARLEALVTMPGFEPAAPPEEDAPEEDPDYWSIELSLSASLSEGSSEVTELSNSAEVAYDDVREWEFAIGLSHYFLLTDGETKDHELIGFSSADYLPNSAISPFGFGEVGFDESAKQDMIWKIGVGAKWTFLRLPWDIDAYADDPEAHYSLSVAVLENFESYQPATGIDDRHELRLSFRFKGEHHLTAWLTLKDTFFFVPVIDDFNDYEIENTAKLKMKVTGNLSVSLVHAITYDSTPATDTDTEQSLTFELSLEWP